MEDKARSSILDLPQPTLFRGLWEDDNKTIKKVPELFLINLIRTEVFNYDSSLKINAALLYGSLCGYNYHVSNYVSTSDLDVSVYIDWVSFTGSEEEVTQYFKNKVWIFPNSE